jgi:hypothetical protein
VGITAATAWDEQSGVVDPPGRGGGNLEIWSTTSFTGWASSTVEENAEGTCIAFAAAGAGGVSGGYRDTA